MRSSPSSPPLSRRPRSRRRFKWREASGTASRAGEQVPRAASQEDGTREAMGRVTRARAPTQQNLARKSAMANTSTQPTERVARLVTQLAEARVNPRCSACGHDEWDYGLTVTTLPLPVPQESGEGLEVFILICTNCGHVRVHSAQHLEKRAVGY